MTPAQASGLVHAPLQEWAQSRGDAIAIRCGDQQLSFAALFNAVSLQAQALQAAQAPVCVLINPAQGLVSRLVEFLAVASSGRCAAVGDPDWPAAVLASVRAAMPTAPFDAPAATPLSPFYVGFTSGSTGKPKGFRRNHRSWAESFRVCLQDFGPLAATRILAPGRDGHSLFLFGMLLGLWTGAGVEVQERFSAAAALDSFRQGDTPSMVTSPSQLVLMLDVAQHRKLAPLNAVQLIMISGARWMRKRTPELQVLFPQARIIEFYGASETSFIAWMDSDAQAPTDVVGHPFSNVAIDIRKTDANDSTGLIYVRSPMVFMDYFGQANDHTAALRDGEWLSVRDLGRLDAQSRLCLAGRENRMIVTRGKNLFAEELEAVLEAHPAIASASVHGLDDARRGALVVAVVRWVADTAQPLPNALQLKAWCQGTLEAYKAPRRLFACADWPLTASGKPTTPAWALRYARWMWRQATPPLWTTYASPHCPDSRVGTQRRGTSWGCVSGPAHARTCRAGFASPAATRRPWRERGRCRGAGQRAGRWRQPGTHAGAGRRAARCLCRYVGRFTVLRRAGCGVGGRRALGLWSSLGGGGRWCGGLEPRTDSPDPAAARRRVGCDL